MNSDVELVVNSLRLLSIDMISHANAGHPGICLGAAPILYSLYANHLNTNPSDPEWPNRDRFVMSCGHGSALLYATLFMAGYDLTIDDLVNFCKINSKTPGHPEYKVTPGVDVTTGMLGEGFATAVGMAIAEKYLAAIVDEKVPKQKLIKYYVYCLVSDGDIMEGVFNEAASLAGNLSLDNLIVLYDSNNVTLDGPLKHSLSENTIRKLIDMGWEVDYVSEGNNVEEIDKAIDRAKINKKPTLIEIKTIIGRGSVYEGSNIVHSKPLTKDDVLGLRKKYGINTSPMQVLERPVQYMKNKVLKRVKDKYDNWQKLFNEFKENSDESLAKIMDFIETKSIEKLFDCKNFKIQNNYNEELRESSSKIMNIISERSKFFLGGSADAANSTHTALYKEINFTSKYRTGKNISFGVREHAMGSILNGIALSGFKCFGSTFLAFADFLKPAIRLSAMMDLPVTYIFTHDSVDIGADGPTHQPIEQLAMLRTTPNLIVLRPADINEVLGSWDIIINNNKPVALVLSKQEAHILAGTNANNTKYGAYVVKPEANRIDAIVISTGSDFTTAYLVTEELRAKGIDIRLISMPSMELFLEQTEEYQNAIIPKGVKVFTIEASSSLIWNRFASNPNCAIGIDEFGLSGSKQDVKKKLNFDYDSILNRIYDELNSSKYD